ncbi:hypothetical protein HYALB_00008136 [Hymenoscyphus albidus]|uniref:Alpha-galactosidase n=1 Tax=Hymenoscyphus albidus TaxID=595503 RepID=A0A9N9LGE5_9HELO|nr:hypothetical protein HYALB_00008136 [Hymenoscyphus albidus]
MFVLLNSKTFGAVVLAFFLVDATPFESQLEKRLDNNLAKTPILGWNSYNHYSCSPNEKIIKSNAQALVDLGLQALGYNYVVVDCGWTVPDRATDGQLQPNPDLFPSGYKALGDWLHKLDLKFGVYQDAGIKTCMTGQPDQAGSLNNEATDAKTFESWGADLLKYDNCYSDADLNYPTVSYTPKTSPKGAMTVMSKAIQSLSKPMIIQICNWGVDFPSAWAPEIGNSWRVTNDITGAWRTVPRILNQVVSQTTYGQPGRWLDLDMLQVGNNLFTEPEEQTHFSLWAIIKSPLIIGGALSDTQTNIVASSLAILSNKDVISYNQDGLGVPARFARRYTKEGYEVWYGPLTEDRTVVAVINLFNEPRNLTLDFPDISIQKAKTVKNIWAKTTAENVVTSYTAEVGAHGTMLLELGGTTAFGIYNVSDAVGIATEFTFKNVYAKSTSKNLIARVKFEVESLDDETILMNQATYTLPAGQTELTIPNFPLQAGNNNIVAVDTRLTITELNVYDSTPMLLGADIFEIDAPGTFTQCLTGLCLPVGSKIGNLSPTVLGTAGIMSPPGAGPGPKYANVYFTNNDIAFQSAFDLGTNTRNLTINVNGVITRIEVPLSGKSSELLTEHKGWQDAGLFPVLLEGFQEGGLVQYAADFVGMEVYW